ncbi:MAG: MBL fold metallo-hydrolase [Gemmatimonadota bacterium]|nr:MBL fold metallo-hydrolase [Gemmatimonadota bacterium]
MRMWLLGSGSRGNAIVLESGDTRVLIDAGFAASILVGRMRAVEIAPESIAGVVVTHEHTDHVRGVRVLCERFGWAAHATVGTIAASRDLASCKPTPCRAGDGFVIGDIDILTVRASHDAVEPVVLIATSRSSGARAGIAYDLGVVTQSVTDAMRDLDMLVLEANHDELMLQSGPYPASVRARISGRSGHLSNGRAGQLAREVAHKNLRHIVLAHISETCNSPRTALTDVGRAISRARFTGRLSAAAQDRVVGPFEPGIRSTRSVQLALGL